MMKEIAAEPPGYYWLEITVNPRAQDPLRAGDPWKAIIATTPWLELAISWALTLTKTLPGIEITVGDKSQKIYLKAFSRA